VFTVSKAGGLFKNHLRAEKGAYLLASTHERPIQDVKRLKHTDEREVLPWISPMQWDKPAAQPDREAADCLARPFFRLF
jgi:hypothetical protein